MAQVLASVIGDVLARLPEDLRQAMYDEMAAIALESVEHVVASRPEEVKRHISELTRVYVLAALRQVAAQLNLEPPKDPQRAEP